MNVEPIQAVHKVCKGPQNRKGVQDIVRHNNKSDPFNFKRKFPLIKPNSKVNRRDFYAFNYFL